MGTNGARIMALVVAAATCQLPTLSRAQTGESIAVTVSSDGHEVWVQRDETDRCSPPCRMLTPSRDADVRVAPAGASRPQHRFLFTLREESELHVARWSRDGERIAGGAILGGGWAAGLATSIGMGAALAGSCTGCVGSPFFEGLLAAGTGLGIGLLFSAIGGALLALDDVPYIDVRDRRGTRRIAPDNPVPRVLAGIGLGLAATTALVAIGAAIGAASGGLCGRRCGEDAILGGVDAALASSLIATPLIVTLAGDMTGGRGHIVAALLGTLAGPVAGALLFAIAAPLGSRNQVLEWSVTSLAVAAAVGLAGAIVGYEIANGDARGATQRGRERAHSTALVPVAVVIDGGVTVGALGAF